MDRIKIQGYLNLAQKAGALIRGADSLDGYNKKLYLVLIDKTAGKSTQKIASRFSEQVTKLEVEDLDGLVGKGSKIIGIKNKGLSEEIAKLIKE